MTKADARTLDRDTAKRFHQQLDLRPLDVADEQDRALHVRLEDDRHDPVRRMIDVIDFAPGPSSLQLVAGFRGTGKTTSYSRLAKQLVEAGCYVARIDMEELLGPSPRPDIVDVLLALVDGTARAFEDQGLGKTTGAAVDAERKELARYVASVLKRASLELADKVLGLPLSRWLVSENQDVQDRKRAALRQTLPELAARLGAYQSRLVDRLRKKQNALGAKIVVIADSLEHLRFAGGDEDALRDEFEQLLITHGRYLQLPDSHVVMTVPPFIALRAEEIDAEIDAGGVQLWGAVRVRRRDGSVDPEALRRLVEVVDRRCEWQRIVPSEDALHELVLASGGYVRDLLQMMKQAVMLAMDRGVTKQNVDAVLSWRLRAYMPIWNDWLEVLRTIAAARDVGAVPWAQRNVVRSLLDRHMVLPYLNDDLWYDLHPLLRGYLLERSAPDGTT